MKDAEKVLAAISYLSGRIDKIEKRFKNLENKTKNIEGVIENLDNLCNAFKVKLDKISQVIDDKEISLFKSTVDCDVDIHNEQ